MEGKYLGQAYRRRWYIEACFQAFKSRGFDRRAAPLESTHLKELSKLKKLLAFVSIAYGLCISLGVYHHQKVQPIKVKKHGNKANSFFRIGLDNIRTLLKKEKQGW